jgi:hypothetical protein
MKRLIILTAALLMAACQPMPAADAGSQGTDVSAQTPTRSPSSFTAAECTERGGKMLPQGRMQSVMCVLTYTDAGQRCTDGDDCQGNCRIEDVAGAPQAGQTAVGQCQASSSSFGCYTTVEGGKAEPTICVD